VVRRRPSCYQNEAEITKLALDAPTPRRLGDVLALTPARLDAIEARLAELERKEID